jgi:diguanylate cyclase (GGDEF)-like protein/PAS domain S-box-containing protein
MILSRKDIISIVLKIALIECLAEGMIMWALHYVESYLNPTLIIYLDPLLLVLCTTPLIAYFVIKPYIISKNTKEGLISYYEEQIKLTTEASKVLLDKQYHEQERALKKVTEDVILKEERYTLAAKGSNEGIWDWDIASGKIFYSKRWNEMIGFDETELDEGKEIWFQRVHPEDCEKLLYHIEEALNSSVEKNYQCEYRMLHKNGHYLWVVSKWVTIFNAKGCLVRMVGAQSDIEKNKKIEEQLVHDAMHDFLTKLPNRNLLNDRLQQALLRFKRAVSEDFALVLFDLDNFKYINDSMGHPVGDKLLIHVGKSLASIVRNSDTISRLGGDEFAVIIQKPVDKHSFNMMITRIASVLSSPIKIEDYLINPSVSMGIVWCNKSAPYTSSDEIFRDADIALYHAKKSGKSRFVFYDNDLREEAQKRFRISNNLKSALNKNQFSVFYQPIVFALDGQVAGFEALLRWNHPELGFVPPDQFIPIAEESDMIVDLGNFVIQKSCETLSKLMEEYNPERNWYVCINVSAKQLENNDIIFEIERAVKDNFLTYKNIKVEVTESILLKNSDSELYILEELRKKGIQIAIDDFGTGYSSLSTLHHFPFSFLKIDRSFITNLLTQPKLKSMIKSIILMAKTLDMKLVVEGVEHVEQYNVLKEMEADYIQGYYFSKPLPLVELQISIRKSVYPLEWPLIQIQNQAK